MAASEISDLDPDERDIVAVHMTDLHVAVVQAAERSATGRRRRLTFETAGGV
jgi:hypothetical protein